MPCDAVLCYRCRMYSVGICVFGARVSCAKTAEPIEMPFGWRTRLVYGPNSQRTLMHVSSESHTRRSAFECEYANMRLF